MRRKTSGNTCARPISPTACSKTTPQSSTLASSHGVAFSTSSVASSPSPAVIGLLPVNHSEVWYKQPQRTLEPLVFTQGKFFRRTIIQQAENSFCFVLPFIFSTRGKFLHYR